MASTLTRTSRSMPAMPMAGAVPRSWWGSGRPAGRRAPPGPGAHRQYAAIGARVATAARKTSVRLASRIDSAISLGVLRREVPSTSAIILSRKVSPGRSRDADDDAVGQHACATRDGTPVAARLPDDRGGLAGDGRLVDRGDALDDVPVARDDLPGLDDHQVADGELGGGHAELLDRRRRPGGRRCRCGSGRSDAACALPRPSATASARLPKSTVSQSQTAIEMVKTSGSAAAATVVTTDPSRTRNITGERHRWRGSSLRRASGSWRRLGEDGGSWWRCS